ncbi:MAG: hypothetical protein WCP20_07650 [Desulfuromonadales bacterium]
MKRSASGDNIGNGSDAGSASLDPAYEIYFPVTQQELRNEEKMKRKTPLPRSKSDRKSGVIVRAENMAVTNDGSTSNEERRGVTPPRKSCFYGWLREFQRHSCSR